MSEDTQVKTTIHPWPHPGPYPTKEAADAELGRTHAYGYAFEHATTGEWWIGMYTTTTLPDHSQFRDLKRRVRNSAPCRVRYLRGKPGCWPYGELLIVTEDPRKTFATFGDLTVQVTDADEVAQLVALAGGQFDLFTQDLEWKG